MKKLKQLFCKHDFISLGAYYGVSEGDWNFHAGLPHTYVNVWEAVRCEKCSKVKHNKLLSKKFLGWNDNRRYQNYLIKKDIPHYEDWLLD